MYQFDASTPARRRQRIEPLTVAAGATIQLLAAQLREIEATLRAEMMLHAADRVREFRRDFAGAVKKFVLE